MSAAFNGWSVIAHMNDAGDLLRIDESTAGDGGAGQRWLVAFLQAAVRWWGGNT